MARIPVPINYNHYNFRKKNNKYITFIKEGFQYLLYEVKNSYILEIPQFCEQVVVTVAIVISSMIGGFSSVDLVWLAALTVWLQVPTYGQLCDRLQCTITTQQNK